MAFNAKKAKKNSAQITEKGSLGFEGGDTAVLIVATDSSNGEWFTFHSSFQQEEVKNEFGVTGSPICLDLDSRFAKIGMLSSLGYPSNMKFDPVKTLVQKLNIQTVQENKKRPVYAKETFDVLVIPVAFRSNRNGRTGSWEPISTGSDIKLIRAKMGKDKEPHIMKQLIALFDSNGYEGIVDADTDFTAPQKCVIINRSGKERDDTKYVISDQLVELSLKEMEIAVDTLPSQISEALEDFSPVRPETVYKNMILSYVQLEAIAESKGVNNFRQLICGDSNPVSDLGNKEPSIENTKWVNVEPEGEASEGEVEEEVPF